MVTDLDRHCGDLGMHWYRDGDTCLCGQVPVDIFFAANCDCGVQDLHLAHEAAIHSPKCAFVRWAERRNAWVQDHPEAHLKSVEVKKSVYYKDWYNGRIPHQHMLSIWLDEVKNEWLVKRGTDKTIRYKKGNISFTDLLAILSRERQRDEREFEALVGKHTN